MASRRVLASGLQAGQELRKCFQCRFFGAAVNGACSKQGPPPANGPRPPLSQRSLVPCLLPARRALHHTACLRSDKELEENPFYSKYEEKLGKVQSYITEKAEQKKVAEEKVEAKSRPHHHPHPTASYTTPPSLESVMYTSMIMDKTTEEVSKIWREYHATRNCISAIIPADSYLELHTKASYCPLFLHPLPRDSGYEFLYSQFSGHRCFFTSLVSYQKYGESAPVCLTLSHYTELQENKGIVLMAGDVDASVLTTLEAQFLANQLQLYYASGDQERYALVRQFNYEPEHFSYQKLIEQLQNSGIKLQKQ